MSPAPSNRQDTPRDNGGGSQQPEGGRNLVNKLLTVTDDVVAAPEPVSTLQRFRIHVPTPYTHFLLGERVKGNAPFGYTGSSLQTDGNLFVDIKEDTVVQTKGFTLLQSDDLWQQYSKALMELSSPAAVKVVGGQVFLGAISAVGAPAFKANNGAALEANAPNDLAPAMDHLKKVGSYWDTGLSVLSLVATGVFFSPLNTTDTNSWIKTAETAWSTGKKLYDMGAKLLAAPKPKKDVNIYGQDGVNLMSPEKISLTTESSMKLFAQMGVTISSGLSSTMMAVQGVKAFGGLKASLEGGTYADVKAGIELGVSCMRGKVKIKGKEIEIGTHDPKWTQLPTDKIKSKALKEISFDSKELLKINTGTSTKVEAKENFEVKAEKAVKIFVGSYAIEIKPEGIKIGKGGDGAPSDPLVHIEGETITLNSSGMGMKINKSRVHMGKAGNHFTITDSGTCMLKGKVIKLG